MCNLDKIIPHSTLKKMFRYENVQYKCKDSTADVIDYVLSHFETGSREQMGRCVTKIKSVLGDTLKSPDPKYTKDEIIEAATLYDSAVTDECFYYEGATADKWAYGISTWMQGGAMRKQYAAHVKRKEDKAIDNLNNKYKRPHSAMEFASWQDIPHTRREKIKRQINDLLVRNEKAYGQDYTQKNLTGIVSDFYRDNMIYNPLEQEYYGQKFKVQYI